MHVAVDNEAYICSYDCTFCRFCSEKMKYTCLNCGDEVRMRPRRLIRE